MKILSDNSKVPARMYYYLLDFNMKSNWKYIRDTLKKNSLKELNKAEFIELFKHATSIDLAI